MTRLAFDLEALEILEQTLYIWSWPLVFLSCIFLWPYVLHHLQEIAYFPRRSASVYGRGTRSGSYIKRPRKPLMVVSGNARRYSGGGYRGAQ
jgi:hypothetical protein